MQTIARSILDIDNGHLKEKADYKLSEIMANIYDANANPKTVRELNIKIKFKPVEDGGVVVSYTVANKLASMKDKELIVSMQRAKDPYSGELIDVLVETNNQAPGQLNLNGDIFEPQMVLIGIGAEKLVNKEGTQEGK